MLQLEIIEQTGWTVEYVDSLDSKWIANYNAITNARAIAQDVIRKRGK